MKNYYTVRCWLGQRTFSDLARVICWLTEEYPYWSHEQRKTVRCTCGITDFTNVVLTLTERQVERHGWVLIDRLAK